MDNGILRKRRGDELPRQDDRRRPPQDFGGRDVSYDNPYHNNTSSGNGGGGWRGGNAGRNHGNQGSSWNGSRRGNLEGNLEWGAQPRGNQGSSGDGSRKWNGEWGAQPRPGQIADFTSSTDAENKRKEREAREDGLKMTPEQLGRLKQGAVDGTVRWLRTGWKTIDDKRIAKGAPAAAQDNDSGDDDVSYDPGYESEYDRAFADVVVKFDPSPIPLPPYYLEFVSKLPECSLPLQKKSGHIKCYCPLSHKLKSWRVEHSLTLDERYIPFCSNNRLMVDQGLDGHLKTWEKDGDEIDWHQIVSKYLELLLQGSTGKGVVHKAF
jgi:hypothetical protein